MARHGKFPRSLLMLLIAWQMDGHAFPHPYHEGRSCSKFGFFDWLCWDLKTCQPLWVILCCLPKKGRKEIEEIVEEMKEKRMLLSHTLTMRGSDVASLVEFPLVI